MKFNKYVDEAMSVELNELMAGEHAHAVKGLVHEAVNNGFRKGILYGLVAVTVGTIMSASVANLSKSIINKYQKP